MRQQIRSKKIYLFIIWLFVLLLGLIGCTADKQKAENDTSEDVLINLDHLEYLQEEVEIEGEKCRLVHIYAEAPDYHRVEATGEGISCVDDVARTARVYLQLYESSNDTSLLMPLKDLLRFVLVLQAEDGDFYNFVNKDLSINKEHKNSTKSFGWWAARGYRSIALALPVFDKRDPEFHNQLTDACVKSESRMKELFLDSRESPEIGQDVAAILVLGLLARRTDGLNENIDNLVSHFAEQIYRAAWIGNSGFNYRIHKSWRNIWHAYGALQSEALARAGKALNHPAWISSAQEEIDGFQRWLIAEGMLAHIEFEDGDTVRVKEFSQIAYDVSSIIACQKSMYDITGDTTYATWAGLAASWFFGNNPAGKVMYDKNTGRCYDGIISSGEINFNSGAESTIEALLALNIINALPHAAEAMDVRRVENYSGDGIAFESANCTIVINKEKNILNLTVKHKQTEENL
ncbi:MAG: hypothetical protein P9L92_05640 [Candidatus Electryonea clarkiae]|nr:hypothetical protein [Candidatus Electryonea clarkiae]MDP8289332.1 hypothetical protein [Candidatus Electryonea clarkiae]